VKFVTLKAYEKAGGAVRRDLFAQDDDGVFIQDIVLLESLVAKKLEKTAAAVRKEGWKWVEVRGSFDYSEWSKCGRRYPQAPPIAADEQAELDALTKEYDELAEAECADDSAEANPRLDEIAYRIEEIEGGEKSWQPDTLAIAGAVVTIGHDGKADIHYGYVKPEDAPKKKPNVKTVTNPEDGTVTTVEEEGFTPSAALTESLTAHRTAAISAALTGNSGVALAAVVHGMALQVFHDGHSGDTSLQITALKTTLRDLQDAPACAVLEQIKTQWGDCLPGNPQDLWTWCLQQPQDILLDLLACCAAFTVNAVRRKSDRADDERSLHADRLAAALRLDMTAWFRPTAANYFSRISKPGILAALQEVKGATAPAWAKAKKSELAAIAEREVVCSDWLPAALKRPA
jgi:ParB family chromosome partitioning protein